MASQPKSTSLSIIIPCLNEGKELPLLLADLKLWRNQSEILIIDGGSTDLTCLISKISGAKLIETNKANRGLQVALGAENSHNDWLLFIHGDSRLPNNWHRKVEAKMHENNSEN